MGLPAWLYHVSLPVRLCYVRMQAFSFIFAPVGIHIDLSVKVPSQGSSLVELFLHVSLSRDQPALSILRSSIPSLAFLLALDKFWHQHYLTKKDIESLYL